MKKVNLFFLAALAVVLLAGCSPDDKEQLSVLEVSPNMLSFGGLEHITQVDDAKFTVKNRMSSEITVTVASDARAWLKIAKQGEAASESLTVSANTKMDIYLNLTRNNTGLLRQGTITVADGSMAKEVIVKQAGAYKVGDYYPDPLAVYNDGVLRSGREAIGIVYWLDAAAPDYNDVAQSGLSGKIVSLDEGTSLVWSLSDVGTNATSKIDGLANMEVIKGGDNTFGAYPAFAWVDQKNGVAGTAIYASGDKGIWYLPAWMELIELYVAYDAYIKDYFNAVLTSAGGMPFVDDIYWSSTDVGILASGNAYYTNFERGGTYSTIKSYGGSVRCVMEF